METKANYTLVGFFTLIVIAAAFGFVYWMATFGKSGQLAQLEIRIPGSAAGLSVGAPVLFNGIRIGAVQSLTIDGVDPNFVLAMTEVRAAAPVYADTKAKLGIQGLTGQSHIELSGGSTSGQNILEKAVEEGSYAVLTAEESSVTNILATAEDILGSVKDAVTGIQDFVDSAKGPLIRTAENAETFSDALAANSDGISEFLKSVSSLSETIQNVSGKLESVMTRADTLLAAIDPDQVKEIVGNVDTVSKNLADASADVKPMVDEFKQTAENLSKLSQDANSTLARVDTLIASVDPEQIRTTVDNVAAASEQVRQVADTIGNRNDDINQIITNVDQMTASVDPEKVRTTLDNIAAASEQARQGIASLATVADTIGNRNDDINQIITNVDQLTASVDPEQIRTTVDNVAAASEQVRQVADTIGNRNDDINQIITNVDELSAQLNEVAVQAQATLKKIDGFIGSGNTDGLIAEARKTLQTIQKIANTIDQHIGPIATNIQRFTGSGLRDFDALVAEARRSITRVERTITQIGDQPQSLIFGTSGEVQRYDGRRRR
jgi:phospholipid/cholesterol/gamma-HCH transport system substrate-binding protein